SCRPTPHSPRRHGPPRRRTGRQRSAGNGTCMTSHQGTQDPRVAVLVYNDCANDSRVLKESATLGSAGYITRIVAVERREKGYMAGRSALSERLDLER